MSAPDSGTWPFYDAIKHIYFNASETKTLTWSTGYDTGSGDEWAVWCQGLRVTKSGGPVVTPTPSPSPTPTASPSATPTVSATTTVSPTVSATMSATPSPTPSATPTATPRQYGDADGDYDIDAADFSQVRQVILEKDPPNAGTDADADADVDPADFSQVRNIIFEMASASDMEIATYDFSTGAGVDNVAVWKNIAAIPADHFGNETGWTEATSPQYNNISLEDTGDWTIDGVAGNYTALQCRFGIGEAPGNITCIDVSLVGSSEVEGDLMRFYLWNASGGAWTSLGEWASGGMVDFSMSTGEDSYSANTFYLGLSLGEVFDDYVDGSGDMYVLYAHNTSDRDLTIDYIDVQVMTPDG